MKRTRHLHLMIIEEVNGKYNAYAEKAPMSTNLLSLVGHNKDIISIQVAETWKAANETVDKWNEDWKAQGRHFLSKKGA